MNEIFEKNWEIFKARNPELGEQLSKEVEKFKASPNGDPKVEVYRVIDGPNGLKNLLYARAEPAYQTLYHRPDGISEAHRLMRETNLKYPQLVFFFGLGLGYILEEFLNDRPKENKGIVVCEKNPQIFFHMLASRDLSKTLLHHEIIWLVGYTIHEAVSHLVTCFEIFATVNRSIKILALPAALESETEYYSLLAQNMFQARDQSTIWAGNSVDDSFQGLMNICDNLEFLLQNSGIDEIIGKFKGKTVISVAAGPSVNGAWDVLKRVQGKIPIIACDTMLKPMNERGVVPDIITALERDPIVADLFRGQPVNERSTLIGPALLLPDAWEQFKGRKVAYCPTVAYSGNLGLSFLRPFAPGSSAGNLNLALAQYMGFSNIIMIGHNLAYALGSGESHVKGTIDPERERHRSEEEMRKIATGGKVQTADGLDEVYTIVEYNLFRKQIENMIAREKTSTWLNCAAKGAAIQGSSYMPLEEAVEKYGNEPYDIYPDLVKAFRPPPVETIKARHQIASTRLRDTIKTLETAKTETHELQKKVSRWYDAILADEAQGKKWSDAKLNSKIDEFLKMKVQWVNENATFFMSAIAIIHPAHIAFERTINEMPGRYDNNYDLKKDFIKQHIQYFGLWNAWIPKLLAYYQKTMNRFEATLPPDYLEDWKGETPNLSDNVFNDRGAIIR